MRDENKAWITGTFIICFALMVIVGGSLLIGPHYRVYSEQLAGEAKLREAESSRQIAVLEAKAAKESAQLKAEAEVIRAQGAAQANEILGNSLKDKSEYLQYLYITGLQDKASGNETIIYVPTEGGMPLPALEAGRLNQTKAAQ